MFTLFTPTTEIKRFKKGTLPKLSLLVIILLPLLYSALYLWAFWDPFNKTQNLPVAIVNNDVGTLAQGKKLNAGDQIINQLKNNNELQWHFTNNSDAEQGVKDGKYYFSVTLDKDFSKNIASPLSMDPHKATLKVQFNNKNNYIASVVGKTAIMQLQEVISSSINTKAVNQILVAVGSAGDGLKQAADGAKQIDNGAGKLYTGSGTLSKGLDDANNGAFTLSNGLDTAKAGTSRLATGVKQFSGGMNKIGAGAQELSDKLGQAQGLVTGLTNTQGQLKTSLENILNSLSSSSNPATKQLLASISPDLANLQNTLNNLPDSAEINKLFSGTKQLAYQLNNQQSPLLQGLSALDNGINQLDNGMTKLQSGGRELSSGLTKLDNGSKDLQSGLGELKTGSNTLAVKLSGGAKLVPNIPANKAETISNTLANPLATSLNYENIAPTFGYGFAPFFIPLALFVGGLITWIMIKPMQNNTLVTKMHSLKSVLTSFSPGMITQILQATAIFLVIRFGLNLHPAKPIAAWLTMVLVAVCFAAMIQMFNIIFGPAIGKVVSMAFLMIQLVASGGVYPVETQPKILETVHKFDPMTYAVNALRATIMGGFDAANIKDITCLLLVTIGCLALSCWGAYRDRIWDIKRLHPPIQT